MAFLPKCSGGGRSGGWRSYRGRGGGGVDRVGGTPPAEGARRRLRRDIAALVARMREHVAMAPHINCLGRVSQPGDRITAFERSRTLEPTTGAVTRDERERRLLADRFGSELHRVLHVA